MKDDFDLKRWGPYLDEFTRRNRSRPTVLEVFGDNGALTEERGLPLVGITLEHQNGTPIIEIMLGNHDGMTPRHLTHMIANVRDITPKLGPDGLEEALAIVDEHGEMSLLRFDPQPKATESVGRQPSCCQVAV